jgi:hypothetical protein
MIGTEELFIELKSLQTQRFRLNVPAALLQIAASEKKQVGSRFSLQVPLRDEVCAYGDMSKVSIVLLQRGEPGRKKGVVDRSYCSISPVPLFLCRHPVSHYRLDKAVDSQRPGGVVPLDQ